MRILSIVLICLFLSCGYNTIRGVPEVVPKETIKDQDLTFSRSVLQKPLPKNRIGIRFQIVNAKHTVYGVHYGRVIKPQVSWFGQLHYTSVSAEQMRYDFLSAKMVMMTSGYMFGFNTYFEIGLPLLKDEPAFKPYTVVGGGYVLGLQQNIEYRFPESWSRGNFENGYTFYIGPGISFFFDKHYLNFDVYYQIIRFPQVIFDGKRIDGLSFSLIYGKNF